MSTPQVPPPGEDSTGQVPSPYQPGPAAPPGPARRRLRGRSIGLSAVAALFAIIVIGSIASNGGKSHQGSRGTPGAATSTAAPAATAQALSASAQQFASDLQSSSQVSIGSSTSSTQIAAYGQQVCSMRQAGQKQTAVVSYTETAWSNMSPMLADAMTRLAEHDMCANDLPAQTVTYIVRGTPGTQVTYGPAGSDYNGSVPMKVIAGLGDPEYYAISAQLQGGGSVRCSIEVDGIPVSTASASGGYNIADCEIGQDPITSVWENDNSGYRPHRQRARGSPCRASRRGRPRQRRGVALTGPPANPDHQPAAATSPGSPAAGCRSHAFAASALLRL